jgi:hypothetical protein
MAKAMREKFLPSSVRKFFVSVPRKVAAATGRISNPAYNMMSEMAFIRMGDG